MPRLSAKSPDYLYAVLRKANSLCGFSREVIKSKPAGEFPSSRQLTPILKAAIRASQEQRDMLFPEKFSHIIDIDWADLVCAKLVEEVVGDLASETNLQSCKCQSNIDSQFDHLTKS